VADVGNRIMAELAEVDIHHLVSVANFESAALYRACRAEGSGFRVVEACREGEAVAICAGLYLGGSNAALIMENLGLFECLDSIRALLVDMRIPILLFVGYVGRPQRGAAANWRDRSAESASQVLLAGRWTLPALRLADIPFFTLDSLSPDDIVRTAWSTAVEREGPVALLVENMSLM
jgi:sulfopyruvate decarboxylase TPP-binding subunit